MHSRDDIDYDIVSRKEGGRRKKTRHYCGYNYITTRKLHKKAQRETNYSEQKQHRQHKHQQNNNNY